MHRCSTGIFQRSETVPHDTLMVSTYHCTYVTHRTYTVKSERQCKLWALVNNVSILAHQLQQMHYTNARCQLRGNCAYGWGIQERTVYFLLSFSVNLRLLLKVKCTKKKTENNNNVKGRNLIILIGLSKVNLRIFTKNPLLQFQTLMLHQQLKLKKQH